MFNETAKVKFKMNVGVFTWENTVMLHWIKGNAKPMMAKVNYLNLTLSLKLFCLDNLYDYCLAERFSVDCRSNYHLKVITLAIPKDTDDTVNQSKHEVITRRWCKVQEHVRNKCESWWVLFVLLTGWNNGMSFLKPIM